MKRWAVRQFVRLHRFAFYVSEVAALTATSLDSDVDLETQSAVSMTNAGPEGFCGTVLSETVRRYPAAKNEGVVLAVFAWRVREDGITEAGYSTNGSLRLLSRRMREWVGRVPSDPAPVVARQPNGVQ